MSDSGHAAAEFGLAVGLLVLPVALAVLAFGPWSETRVAAEAAAAEAARTAVLEVDLDAGLDVMREIASNHGFGPGESRLGWCGAAPTGQSAGVCPIERGGSVIAEVEFWTPLISTPWGEIGGLWVGATHAEPVDLYRSLE